MRGNVPPGSPASSSLLPTQHGIVVVPIEVRLRKVLVKNRKREKKPAAEVVFDPSAHQCTVIADVEADSCDDDDQRLEYGAASVRRSRCAYTAR